MAATSQPRTSRWVAEIYRERRATATARFGPRLEHGSSGPRSLGGSRKERPHPPAAASDHHQAVAGFDAQVYEQAARFEHVGAGIQMIPNSMKVLRRIGAEEKLRAVAFEPYSHLNREWDTGRVMRDLPMPESLFDAPYLCMHRAVLHAALASVVPEEVIHLNKKLVGLDQNGGPVTLTFADGTTAKADAVIGADGVHSLVRDIIIGPDKPIHRGRIPALGHDPFCARLEAGLLQQDLQQDAGIFHAMHHAMRVLAAIELGTSPFHAGIGGAFEKIDLVDPR